MATTVTEAVRRLTIEATSRGVKEATQDTKALAASMDGVAVSAQRQERATASMESRLSSIQRKYDESFRAQTELVRVEKTLHAAQAQGLITEQRRLELLNLTTNAVSRQNSVVAANDNQWRRRNLSFQLFDVGQGLALGSNPALIAMQQGPQIAQLYAGQGGVNAALKDTTGLLASIARGFGPVGIAAAVAAVGIAGMTHEINEASDVTVSFGNVALAVLQTIGDGIYQFVRPAIEAIAPWFQAAWDGVVSGTQLVVNTLIGAFVGAYKAIFSVWNLLPAALGDLGFQAADKFYQAFTQMLRDLRAEVNSWLASINSALGTSIPMLGGGKIGLNADGTQAHIANPYAGSAGSVGDTASAAFGEGFNRNYTGEFFGAVQARATANALKDVAEAGEAAGSAVANGGKKAEDAWAGLREVTTTINQDWKMMRDLLKDAFSGFGQTVLSALKQGKDLWEAFKQAGMEALDRITSKLLDMAMDQMINWLLGMLFGGGYSPRASRAIAGGGYVGLYHSGGIAGSPSSHRSVDPSVFIGAQRYHSGGVAGLGQDEVPAILQRGERIIPRGQAANQNGAPVINFQITENGQEKAQVSEVNRQSDGSYLIKMVVGEVKKEYGRGGFNKLNAGLYNLAPAKRRKG